MCYFIYVSFRFQVPSLCHDNCRIYVSTRGRKGRSVSGMHDACCIPPIPLCSTTGWDNFVKMKEKRNTKYLHFQTFDDFIRRGDRIPNSKCPRSIVPQRVRVRKGVWFFVCTDIMVAVAAVGGCGVASHQLLLFSVRYVHIILHILALEHFSGENWRLPAGAGFSVANQAFRVTRSSRRMRKASIEKTLTIINIETLTFYRKWQKPVHVRRL